jgi:SM-20-related protein
MLSTPQPSAEVSPRSIRRFRIRGTIDAASTRSAFEANTGAFIGIPHFVNGEAARALYRELRACDAWGLRICDGERMMGLSPEAYGRASAKERAAFTARAYAAAQSGFAFMREELWPANERAVGPLTRYVGETAEAHTLTTFLSFLRGAVFSTFVSAVFGVRSVMLLRLTVECYRPGHFFAFTKGAPPDARFGFCFDLTPTWISEWGGLLEFCNSCGGLAQTYVPRFNWITLYALSEPRGISLVAPFARGARYSVVGQLADG